MAVLSNLQPEKVFYYFEKLCSVPHGSGNTKQISDLCVGFAKELGLKYRQEASNNVIIWKNGSCGYENAAPIILQGHIDMVCAKTEDCTKDMTRDGLDVRTDGEWVWADKTSLGGDNGIAGAMAQRLGIEEGTQPSNVIFDICYKKDELGDPLINDHHAVALGAATYEELNEMYAMTAKINEVLKELFLKMNIKLVDFKIEFGKTSAGEIVLADAVSPATCRLWDATTNEKLDKDRFRRDLGKVREAYEEILARLQKIVG